jgi:hypothetical protein
LIIAPQSLSWQPLIDDLQGGFTARLNAKLIDHHSDLLKDRRHDNFASMAGRATQAGEGFYRSRRARRMEPKQ